MKKTDFVSIIVPCYNEEPVMPLFYEAITGVAAELSEYRFEFIFVDDGSKDGTLETARSLAAKDSRVDQVPHADPDPDLVGSFLAGHIERAQL